MNFYRLFFLFNNSAIVECSFLCFNYFDPYFNSQQEGCPVILHLLRPLMKQWKPLKKFPRSLVKMKKVCLKHSLIIILYNYSTLVHWNFNIALEIGASSVSLHYELQ